MKRQAKRERKEKQKELLARAKQEYRDLEGKLIAKYDNAFNFIRRIRATWNAQKKKLDTLKTIYRELKSKCPQSAIICQAGSRFSVVRKLLRSMKATYDSATDETGCPYFIP